MLNDLIVNILYYLSWTICLPETKDRADAWSPIFE